MPDSSTEPNLGFFQKMSRSIYSYRHLPTIVPQNAWAKFVHGQIFSSISAGMIIAYALVAGVEAQLGMHAALDLEGSPRSIEHPLGPRAR